MPGSRAHPHLHCPHRPNTMHKLVLIRHGESTWNLENRFTGWTDVELTPTRHFPGHVGWASCSRPRVTEFDIAYTSVLKRAIHTLSYCLDEMDRIWLPRGQELAPE